MTVSVLRPGVARETGGEDSADAPDIREHYYFSHKQLNPNRIVPMGPKLNIEAPTGDKRKLEELNEAANKALKTDNHP